MLASNAKAAPSRVRAMQLFHELKQRHPAIPDHEALQLTHQETHQLTHQESQNERYTEEKPKENTKEEEKESQLTHQETHQQERPNLEEKTKKSEEERHSALLLTQVGPHQEGQQRPTRSFTSVQLTLRPPTGDPQPPIDITSKNASLTYSTSSYDCVKGLESRLQITVGSEGASVASMRRRPTLDPTCDPLAKPVSHSDNKLIKQQETKLQRMKIELTLERHKLAAMQEETRSLTRSLTDDPHGAGGSLLEGQLTKEIGHLRTQCDRLAVQVDQHYERQEFYRNIYAGQRHPADFGRPMLIGLGGGGVISGGGVVGGGEDGRWACPKCTFQNHPLIDKCEQCEMAHIVHVAASPGDNIQIQVHSWLI